MGRRGCLSSYLGASCTQDAQSPGWPGACFTVGVGGAGLHRSMSGAQVSLVQPEGRCSAEERRVLKIAQQTQGNISLDTRQGGSASQWLKARLWSLVVTSSETLGKWPHSSSWEMPAWEVAHEDQLRSFLKRA